MTMIRDNISRLKSDISLICQKLGKASEEIVLVAVTKFSSPDQVQEALRNGIRHVGENKVQEALRKYSFLEQQDFKVTKHMIGHLQTNKVKAALEIFDMIQSLDSLKLAREIAKQAKKISRDVDVLIQVNTSGEVQKYGFPEEETIPFIRQVLAMENIRILGLMTIAPLTGREELIRSSFRKLKILRDKIKNEFEEGKKIQMRYLSMGMTSDYAVALEEGANMIRIGRAIFQ